MPAAIISKSVAAENADWIDHREDSCIRSIGNMFSNARAMPAQCTFYARRTRASRGHHAGITRASRGHHAGIKVKPN